MFSIYKKTEDAKLKSVCKKSTLFIFTYVWQQWEKEVCVLQCLYIIVFWPLEFSILCPISCVGIVPSFSWGSLQTEYKAITSFFFTCQCHSRFLVFPYKIYMQVSSSLSSWLCLHILFRQPETQLSSSFQYTCYSISFIFVFDCFLKRLINFVIFLSVWFVCRQLNYFIIGNDFPVIWMDKPHITSSFCRHF